MIDFGLCQTSDEDKVTVPGGLENLTRGQLRDVELLVGVTNVSVASDHLIVQHGHEGLDSEDVVSKNEALHHVHLSTTDLVVTVLLVPNSVLVEPVIGLGLGIKRVSEVAGAGRSDPVHRTIIELEIVDQFFVAALVVLLHNAEVSHRCGCEGLVSGALSGVKTEED